MQCSQCNAPPHQGNGAAAENGCVAAITGSFNENSYGAAQRSMSLVSPSLKGSAIILDLVSPLNKGDTTNAVKIIFFDSLFWLKH